MTLARVGISKQQSHRWQKIAAIPEDIFEAQFTRREAEALTSSHFVRLADEVRGKPGRILTNLDRARLAISRLSADERQLLGLELFSEPPTP